MGVTEPDNKVLTKPNTKKEKPAAAAITTRKRRSRIGTSWWSGSKELIDFFSLGYIM